MYVALLHTRWKGDVMSHAIINNTSLNEQMRAAIRNDFPLLQQTVHGRPLVYLDNANTTQKPNSVIAATDNYYRHDNANIHRSVYQLSERATKHYEAARAKVQRFINAKHRQEIVFTKGTTESINLVANGFTHALLKPDDEILISAIEHHSNIVPWQLACQRTGAVLKVIPVQDNGELDLNAYAQLLTPKTKLLALTHVSNALGTINPVKHMTAMAHAQNIPVLLDGAQGVPHMAVDVQDLDCDFYAFSSHKMYGPTGTGVLYGKLQWLESLPPYQGGGNMIRQVTFADTTYAELPYRFEAGTANIAGVIGLGAAIDYIENVGMAAISAHEATLQNYATERLKQIPGLTIIGDAPHKAAVISFVLDQIHPHDVGTALDNHGIAVRVGHHCAMPLMERFGVPATVRASFAIYNTLAEVDALAEGIVQVQRLFNP